MLFVEGVEGQYNVDDIRSFSVEHWYEPRISRHIRATSIFFFIRFAMAIRDLLLKIDGDLPAMSFAILRAT